jgi:uncharacterized protein YodC (DUF2158 family)
VTKKRNLKPRRQPFKTGDVVRLPVHGAAMTVESCDGDRVCCVWFGIDRFSRWTGPYRRSFRCDDVELTTERVA